jgi:hypothetical protein
MNPHNNVLDLFEPVVNLTTEELPSGHKVTIRETNGADEGILSTQKDAKDASSFDKYLSGIITEHSGFNGKVSPEQVKSMPLSDKYYAHLIARRHSLGDVLKFENTCHIKDCGHKAEFEEDLSNFTLEAADKAEEEKQRAELNKSLYEDPYEGVRPKRYPEAKTEWIEKVLTSKKKIRFKLLTGKGEEISLAVDEGELNKNHELLCRELEVYDPNKDTFIPLTVYDYRIFSSRDMSEIRGYMNKYDPQFMLLSPVVCPKCKTKQYSPLIAQPGFFFPADV